MRLFFYDFLTNDYIFIKLAALRSGYLNITETEGIMNYRNYTISKKIPTAGFIIALLAALSCSTQAVKRDTADLNASAVILSDAEKRGITRAEADIKSGDLKILYYGEKSPVDDYVKYDKETGLRMVNEEWDDLPSNDYPEEVAAYNRTIREYVKKQKLLKKSGRGK